MTASPSRAVRLYGTEQVDPPLRTLRAGPLSVAFDNGSVRYVSIGGTEVIRGISFLVRDENWGTFAPAIENLKIEEGTDGFRVTYRATCADAKRRLVYDASITGRADGSLDFVAEATPETDVLTNRTGFIVLHPIADLAGKPVKVVHENGSQKLSAFPAAIDPRCPFTGVRSLAHEVSPGLWATCTMEGDGYEMEDQRNWSDASYKTYVRTLKKPWPYTLPKGETFTQAVRIAFSGPLPAPVPAGASGTVRLSLGSEAGTMPRIGIGVPAEEVGPALERPEMMRRLAPQLLVCQVDLRLGHGLAQLRRYAELAAVSGSAVVLEIITTGSLDPVGELRPLGEALSQSGLKVEAVTVFPAQDMVSVQPDAPWPPMPTFEETYAAARKAFPGIPLGGGMAAYFTELNRKRPPAALLDHVTFTSCPNVHAADDVSVMETLEAIPHQIRSAAAFSAGRPLRIGPSQLGCRENPYGKATTPNPDNRRACLSRLDPRQRGLFNAAWTLGYVAAAAGEGIDALAMSAPTGAFGLAWRNTDFAQPWFDEAESGLFPAFHIMAGMSRLAGAPRVDVSAAGSGVTALAARMVGGTELWLGNLTAAPRTVTCDAFGSGARAVVLSADGFEKAADDAAFMDGAGAPVGAEGLTLDAHAVARVVLPG